MQIRTEMSADIKRIERLTYDAFLNHPHHAPGAKPTEHLIVNQLRDNDALSLSLVAIEQDIILGHIAFSPVTINGMVCGWYGLGPVSVTPGRQGQGIGSLLINEGIKQLSMQEAQGIVVMGDPGYYNRFGFRAHANLTLPGVPAEYFMVMSLGAHEQLQVQGEVAFSPAFDA